MINDGLYVIGRDCYNMIKIIFTNTMINSNGSLSFKITGIEYDTPLNEATIFNNYEEAKKAIVEIRKNIKDIFFRNYFICSDIIDKQNNIDYNEYFKDLKMYVLKPVLVEKDISEV